MREFGSGVLGRELPFASQGNRLKRGFPDGDT